MIWNWLRNRKIQTSLCFVPLMTLVWGAGPSLGLPSVAARLGWFLLLLLLWATLLLVVPGRKAPPPGAVARLLRPGPAPAAAPAPVPEEVALVRRRLRGAIDALRASHLGRTRGRAALYGLPWCLVLGAPGCGKSSALRNAGLKFTLAAPGAGPDAGAAGEPGPTRGCEWRFATGGVLLDTAGTLAGGPEDRPEWFELLRLLRAHRHRAPVDGVLVALGLGDLARHGADAAVQARLVRQRIGELEKAFGMKVPVYLVVTKMDLLRGFGSFFGALAEDERDLAWGATLPGDQGPGFALAAAVDQRFEELCRGLEQLGTDRLARRAGAPLAALATFPLEFRSLRPALLAFADGLAEPDPYHPRPVLRGFYFTSALQGEEPALSFGDRAASRFGLPPAPDRAPRSPDRAWFLEALFRDVVFPDLAAHRPRGTRSRILRGIRGGTPGRDRWLGRAAAAAGLAGLGVLAGGWTWSFVANRKLVREAREEARAAEALYRGQALADRMKALQILQFRLEFLHRYRREGPPLALRWGLYQGDRLEAGLRGQYLAGVAQTMLEPVRQRLEDALAEGSAPSRPRPGRGGRPGHGAPRPGGAAAASGGADLERAYNTLKTYLMLAHREHMDMAHLADQIPRFWRPWLVARSPGDPGAARGGTDDPATAPGGTDDRAEGLFRMAERTVAFYVSQIHEPDLPLIANRADLVDRARARLRGEVRGLAPLEQIYTEMKTRGNTRFEPMTVARILKDKDLDLVSGNCFIAGSLTREAWDGYFREGFQEASRGGFQGTDWVLDAALEGPAPTQGSPEANLARLEALYKADFAREWVRFLQGLSVREFSDPAAAAAALGRLADPQSSPLKLIVAQAAYETAWDNPSELRKALHAARNRVLERTEQLLGGQSPDTGQRDRPGPLGAQFAVAAALAGPGGGARAPLDGYLELLQKARTRMLAVSNAADPGASARQCLQATHAGGSELAEGLQWLDAMPGGGDTEGRAALRPFLLRPLVQAYAALLPGAEQDLDRAWTQQVFNPWSNLANKYPFADAGNEAQMADILRFLKPGEGTLPRFIERQLAGLLVQRGDSFVPRTWGGRSLAFGPRFLRGIARLSAAAEELQEGDPSRFELQPVPSPGASEITFELDGQKLQYRNGPQVWTGFTWPAPGGFQGARIQVVSFQGAATEVQSAPGRLGLMRLLDQCRVESPRAPTSSLEWKLRPGRASPAGPAPGGIRFNFRMVSGPNPLRLAALRQHALPARIGR